MGVLKQHNVKLQDVLCNHMTELAIVSKDIDHLKKQWDSVTKLANEKYESPSPLFDP